MGRITTTSTEEIQCAAVPNSWENQCNFSGHGGAALMVGLNDLSSLF